MATYRAAVERWPGTPITLRQGARVIEDSRLTRTASWSNKGSREGGRKPHPDAGRDVGTAGANF
jgi:hypothetical protein